MKNFNEKDVEINSGFEKLFGDLKDLTKKVFDDESQNIAAIKKDIVRVSDSMNQIKSLPSEVGELKSTVKEQDATIKLMLDKIANKPVQFKLPTLLTISLIVVSIVVIGTCGLFIHKYLI